MLLAVLKREHEHEIFTDKYFHPELGDGIT